MGLLSAFALMRPLSFAWCGQGLPGPCGALRWAIGSWSPAIKIIAGDQVSFLSFPRGREAFRPARMRAKVRKFWKKI